MAYVLDPDDLAGNPHIVTICGSTRFRAEIAEANRRLTTGGYVVLAPGVFAHDGDEITDQQKAALDRLHLQKIDLAGWIYVVNPGGYVGESTRREIDYAQQTGKTVQYLAALATAPSKPITCPCEDFEYVQCHDDCDCNEADACRCGHHHDEHVYEGDRLVCTNTSPNSSAVDHA